MDSDGDSTYDVPYLNYIHSSDTEEDGSFRVNIYLQQDNEYVMKYSHSSRTLGESDIEYTIVAPDGKILAFDFGSQSKADEAPAPLQQEKLAALASSDAEIVLTEDTLIAESGSADVQEYISVWASLDVLPPEKPCIIFHTFTAPQTGVYSFTVLEKQYSPASHDVPYEFRIYDSDDDSALKLGDITMTPREMLDVQRVLVKNAASFNKDGLPVSFKPEFLSKEVYSSMINSIAEGNVQAARLRAAADVGTYIKPIVHDVPYDVDFQAGLGFYAASGLKAINESAFSNFVMPSPVTGEKIMTITNFKTTEIVTEEEHDREQELEAMSTFALGKNALGQRVLTAMNVRLAQISRTILIRYDVTERQPRLVDVNTLTFKDDALNVLKNEGYEAFSEEYGDYFVAGYKWGLRFQAVISVTTNDSNVLNRACSIIKSIASIAQINGNYSSYINDISDLASSNYLDIDVEEVSINGGDPSKGTFSTVSAVKSVADTLAAFVRNTQATPPREYAPVQVSLRRYREVPAAKSLIPELLPVTQSHFNAILNMNKSILRARCYYNALVSIPLAKLVNSSEKRHQWESEFNTLLDTTRNQINYICESESRAKDYQARFQALYNKYRALCERYEFYQRLVAEQDASYSARGFWNSKEEHHVYIYAGIHTYSQSSIVARDYQYDYHFDGSMIRSATAGTYYTWTITGDQRGYHWRYVWFSVTCHKTNKSYGEDQAFPTVGSQTLKWYFEGGTWRRVDQ